jgi:hypothetical protein
LRGDNGSAQSADHALLEKAVLEVAAMSQNEEIFQERIAELELALEDRGWDRMDATMPDGFQFTRKALDDIVHLSRLYYLKNPVIRRPVDIQTIYVWGQGVSIYGEGVVNDIVQGFLADPSNRRSFSGHDAMMDMERRLRVEGNLFLRFFTTPSTGRVQVRKLPLEEIRAVVYNPDDHDEPWFYIRKFRKNKAQADTTIAYPDWRYARARKAEDRENVGRGGVNMGVLSEYEDAVIDWATPVMHRKTGGFGDMDFGVPETYPAIDWARAYKSALEDYKKTVKSLATWAWKMKMGGGNAQLQAAATQLGTTFGVDDSWTESNPTPVSGSLMAYTGDMDFRAIDVSKAAVDPDGFRRLLLMAASAMGMPEVYYGAAEGTFATAKAMDRPTELQFKDRQALWAEVFTEVLTFAVEAAAVAPGNSALSSSGYDEFTGLMKLRAGGEEVDIEIEVDFPPILQKDVQAYLQSLATFVTMNGQAMQTLNDGPTLYRIALTALGIDNIEEIIEIFYPGDGSESTARPIETYEAPKSPVEVELEKEETAQSELDKLKAQQQMIAQAPLGNQPNSQGPAGGNNKAPVGRGGPGAVARESFSEDEAQARTEFMQMLMEMRREAVASSENTKEA